MALPPAPVNVRLEHDDGTVVPLELAYVGRSIDGLDEWRATTVPALPPGTVNIRADEVPPRCAITIPGYRL